jgi:glutathione synthase/RimK-type ligase-like ATP-grasp enzyme
MRTWRDEWSTKQKSNVLLRWGCTSTLPLELSDAVILNKANSIHRVNNKKEFAQALAAIELSTPVITAETSTGLMTTETYVVRPTHHSQGRNLKVLTYQGVMSILSSGRTSWYARRLVKKAAEYRVYVLFGKVASIARKVVTDETQVAWNHAVGAEFINVKWDEWPLYVSEKAIQAAKLSGLDYAAVDVMVEERTATPWIIEVNSAGSLPPNDDGTPSYRARCVADCLAWHIKRDDYEFRNITTMTSNWRDVIHPAVWSNHADNKEEMPEFRSVRST